MPPNDFARLVRRGHIKRARNARKTPLFVRRAEQSVLIAHHLRDAAKEPATHWHAWAITIAYYAMLHAAKALILERGYEVRTHRAARAALAHLEAIGEEHLARFRDAYAESNAARYDAHPSYTERRLEDVLEHARAFVEAASTQLR